jgi:hypothetical protein
MSPHYVQHDGARWRVVGFVEIDGEAGYELARRVAVPARRVVHIFARVSDCQPDAHEPRRVFRDPVGSVAFFPKRGVIEVRMKHGRKPYLTSISGIITMCARAAAVRRALDRAYKRRVGRGRR